MWLLLFIHTIGGGGCEYSFIPSEVSLSDEGLHTIHIHTYIHTYTHTYLHTYMCAIL